jgi:hypothetical protein
MNERTKERVSGKLKFIYVQLPHFTKKFKDLQTNTDYWLYLLKYLPAFQSCPPEVQGRIFERLFKIARIDQFNSEEMITFNKSILEYNDVRNCYQYAKKEGEGRGEKRGLKRGIKQGIAIGELRGITIGEERGIAIGKELERQKVVEEVVLKCHAKDMSVADIADLTNLSIQEVEDIIRTAEQ